MTTEALLCSCTQQIMADPVVAHDGQVYDHGEDKKSGQPTSEALQAKSRQQPSEEPTADNQRADSRHH